VFLLNYFNELSFSPCGYCDVCLAEKSKLPDHAIQRKIIKQLEEKKHSLTELHQVMKDVNTEKLSLSLNHLIDQGRVLCDRDNILSLNPKGRK
jgi:superfamily II DNA helicase RecQ